MDSKSSQVACEAARKDRAVQVLYTVESGVWASWRTGLVWRKHDGWKAACLAFLLLSWWWGSGGRTRE